MIPTITSTNNNYELEWSSSDVSVATVTQDGTVTAKGVGIATVKAMIKGRKDIQVFCDVQVKDKIFEFIEGNFCSVTTYVNDSNVKKLAYSALTDGDYTKHGRYYFPAGKYKLQPMGNYVEFDQWDFEIVD